MSVVKFATNNAGYVVIIRKYFRHVPGKWLNKYAKVSSCSATMLAPIGVRQTTDAMGTH